MKKYSALGLVVVVIGLLALACRGTGIDSSAMENTRIALAIQQTSFALEMTSVALAAASEATAEVPPLPTDSPMATDTQPGPEHPTADMPPTDEVPPTTGPQPTDPPPTATVEVLYQQVKANRLSFHCIATDGPATLTITVEMSDIDRGAALYWRLKDKSTETITDWQTVKMNRAGENTREFTFNADVWAGTNNFYYPPLMGESWFQIQIISTDGLDRTKVYDSEVTFYPCAN